MRDLRLIGDVTAWGEVAAIGCIGGERYYWLVDADGVVSMMPADAVEEQVYVDLDFFGLPSTSS